MLGWYILVRKRTLGAADTGITTSTGMGWGARVSDHSLQQQQRRCGGQLCAYAPWGSRLEEKVQAEKYRLQKVTMRGDRGRKVSHPVGPLP